ncbi:GGDEF domain-containing protein [Gordonia westfalica]|uniref:GGDEF domain-containing protein n=1 Tax=Gordonia westfalica TaxID=158898 RepID=A0ABU2GYQ1_9ACTN|nr:GGDEF domain-containing protein [Gordonia westfalica]MDS1116583.1 GGDEF domain-containing protein [Gordonia westfalica]
MEEAVGRSPRSTLFSGLGDDPITAEIARHGRLYDETHHVLRQLRVRERHIRYTIAGLVLVFGIVGTLALFTPGGAQGSMWRSLVLAIAAATTVPTAIAVSRVPLGVMWWTKKSHVRGFNNVFVAYADVGLAVCLFATADPRLALYFSALFAVVGSYSAHFVRAHVVYLHMAFSSAVICALGVLAWLDGVPPVTAFSATLALLVAVNGTVTLHQGYTSDLQRTLKHQLRMANTDPLTGLLNRRGFILATTMLLRRGHGDRFTLLVADVDRFKRINDDHGHAVGDLVLQQVAEILEDAVDEPAVVARLGGDEFAIAMPLDEAAARAVADDIGAQPVDTGDGEWATVSLGIAVGPFHGGHMSDRDATERIRRDFALADDALFEAKGSRRGTYAVVRTDAGARTGG